MIERGRWVYLPAVGALLFAICWMAPHRVVDPDVLSRLAMGRWLWTHGVFPPRDPFTFSAPDQPFGDPEWLGDALFFGVYRIFGEGGLQAAAIGIACVGYLLSFGLGCRLGGRPGVMLALLLCSLPAAAHRINARNDLHLLWLFPLLGWLAYRVREHARAWYGVAVVLWLWANLHSSFVVGAAVFAVVVVALPRPRRVIACLILTAAALFPWIGLSGGSAYSQLIDHAIGSPIYRAWLSEWQSPLTSGGILAIAPLHFMCVLGIAGAIVDRKRLDPLQVLLFVLGCVLSYASRRFLPAMAYLIAVAVGPWLSAALNAMDVKWRRAARGAGWTFVVGLLVLALRSAQRRADNSVFDGAPRAAADFLVDNVPRGAHVFNAYNDGPWLTWFGAGAFRHYIDPRNQAGAAALARYTSVIADNVAFDMEVSRLQIDFALLPVLDPLLQVLVTHLTNSPAWTLLYWDGTRALYARRGQQTSALIQRFAYTILRPTLDLRYLAARELDEVVLERELTRLVSQAPIEARVIRAYRELGSGDRALATRAAQVIRGAWPHLADQRSLASALSTLEVESSP